MRLSHGFGPVYDADSRIVILGSFPSVKSREVSFYYGNPQNRFWKVLSQLFEHELPETTADKIAFLHEKHIALWDVVESCEIVGSDDSSIRDVIPVDLQRILDLCQIETVYANGKTAARLYHQLLEDACGKSAIVLPSTSPANAAYSLDRLLDCWRIIVS